MTDDFGGSWPAIRVERDRRYWNGGHDVGISGHAPLRHDAGAGRPGAEAQRERALLRLDPREKSDGEKARIRSSWPASDPLIGSFP